MFLDTDDQVGASCFVKLIFACTVEIGNIGVSCQEQFLLLDPFSRSSERERQYQKLPMERLERWNLECAVRYDILHGNALAGPIGVQGRISAHCGAYRRIWAHIGAFPHAPWQPWSMLSYIDAVAIGLDP
jgi:hypothetical protein